MSSIRRRSPATAAVLTILTTLASAPLSASDGQPAVSASVALGNDYVFRGVSQTLGGAAVQASLAFESSSGLSGYLWGSNVDFVPDGGVDDGATVEFDSALGFTTNIDDRWAVGGMLVHYRFPGTVDDADYDYLEIVGTLQLDDRYAVTVAFSDDVFGSGSAGLHYGLETAIRLFADYELSVGVGHYDLDDAYGASYSHADLSLRRSFDTLSITLALHDTFGDAGALFPDQATGARAVLTLGVDW